MRSVRLLVASAVLALSAPAQALDDSQSPRPDPTMTPGLTCTPQDSNFAGYNPPGVALCRRHVDNHEKTLIAQEYGVPAANWNEYEFDHLIPLCAGGSNDIRNLWPEPLTQAHDKDILEDRLCRELKAGQISQEQAVQQIHAYFEQARAGGPQP